MEEVKQRLLWKKKQQQFSFVDLGMFWFDYEVLFGETVLRFCIPWEQELLFAVGPAVDDDNHQSNNQSHSFISFWSE